MKKVTILLPIHSLDDDYCEMLKNGVNSIQNFYNDVKVSLIVPSKLKSKLKETLISFEVNNLDFKIIENKGNLDFCSQINLGIEKCDTEWFSIMEIDDEYTTNWSTLVHKYIDENPNIDAFLPIVMDVNVEGKILSYTNESAWAFGFSEKQGEIDNEVLLDFQNYQTSGGVYKTEKIKENGSFKENIKLTFSYEFLLRLTHNNVKIMVIPKIGYKHVLLREDSLFWRYKNDDKIKLTEKEVKFWLDTAKKEFFFKNKREIIYVEN